MSRKAGQRSQGQHQYGYDDGGVEVQQRASYGYSKGSVVPSEYAEYSAPVKVKSSATNGYGNGYEQYSRSYEPPPRIAISNKNEDSLDQFANSEDVEPAARLALLKKKMSSNNSARRAQAPDYPADVGVTGSQRAKLAIPDDSYLPPPDKPIPPRRSKITPPNGDEFAGGSARRDNNGHSTDDSGYASTGSHNSPNNTSRKNAETNGYSNGNGNSNGNGYANPKLPEAYASRDTSPTDDVAPTSSSRKPRPKPIPKGSDKRVTGPSKSGSSVMSIEEAPIRVGKGKAPPVPVIDPSAEEDRVQCPDCERKFAPEAFEKHAKVCQKVFMTKRKTFNSTAMRVKGTGAEKFIKKGKNAAAAAEAKPAKQSKWKTQREQLQAALRGAKEYKEAIASGRDPKSIPSAPAPADDRVGCPYCGRKFSENAADRHIAYCKEQQAKKGNLPKASAGPTNGRGHGGKTMSSRR
mmetsp:Transcript_2681/g.4125  ORF Transcript_2681/g.4125 Transcript_2681/m.4125 type:complete len:464 (+) Transcript_2681:156-1547(+)